LKVGRLHDEAIPGLLLLMEEPRFHLAVRHQQLREERESEMTKHDVRNKGTSASNLARICGVIQRDQRGVHGLHHASEPLVKARPLLQLRGIIKDEGCSPQVYMVIMMATLGFGCNPT
jgi:hypothetical protein